MIYCYLFEAKSIQSYLFESGKLKDVIAASERLDRLIDSEENSLLYQVLLAADIQSDLLEKDTPHANDLIRFLRCKGGAFYCYSNTKKSIIAFRSLWTLTIQQMFPSLEYTDAFSEAEQLSVALEMAHHQLAADRNAPSIKYPISTAPTKRYQRTGKVSVPMSDLAKAASLGKEYKVEVNTLDLDSELHRQAYQSLKVRSSAALQNKFTPKELKGIQYPINLDKDFEYSAKNLNLSESERESIKDIALIHIDGNGLGILLMALKTELAKLKADENTYRKAFRNFSEALNKATVIAARKATQFVYDQARYLDNLVDDDGVDKKEKGIFLPMRPIVLGGDDITLLCRADLALEYSKIFCREFKAASEIEMDVVFNESLLKFNSDFRKYLTASGGILYHKAKHPFTHSHHLVEKLCDAAKELTKSLNNDDKKVGPASLAFHRLSNAVYETFDEVVERSLTFRHGKLSFQVGQSVYFVDRSNSKKLPFDLETLQQLLELSTKENAPISISRWRQMMSHVAMNDFAEADRIYYRGLELCNSDELKSELDKVLDMLTPTGCVRNEWYWIEENYRYSVINDLLIMNHFKLISAKSVLIEE